MRGARRALPSTRPSFPEAYVPVFSGGKIIGIVEAYVDQSEKRAAFHARVEWVALALAGIIGVAYGIPALGFIGARARSGKRNCAPTFSPTTIR